MRTVRDGAAFTLVELLIVIWIIAILAALLVVGIGFTTKKARIAKTRSTIQKIATNLELFRQDFGQYPPIPPPSTIDNYSSAPPGLTHFVSWRGGALRDWAVAELGEFSPDDDRIPVKMQPGETDRYDMPSEFLYFFLDGIFDNLDRRFVSGAQYDNYIGTFPRKMRYVAFGEKEIRLTGVINQNTPQELKIYQVVDGWGNPFAIQFVEPAPPPNDLVPTFNTDTFDIVSAGPDGQPGGETIYRPNGTIEVPGGRMWVIGQDKGFIGAIGDIDQSRNDYEVSTWYVRKDGQLEEGDDDNLVNRDNIGNWVGDY